MENAWWKSANEVWNSANENRKLKHEEQSNNSLPMWLEILQIQIGIVSLKSSTTWENHSIDIPIPQLPSYLHPSWRAKPLKGK